MTQKIFSVWEGIYNSFAEAGGDSDAFNSDIWIDKQKSRILKALEDCHTKNTVSKDYPLPLVVAMALAQKEQLKILDFGGGMGLQYLEMIAKVPDSQSNVDYFVVDGKSSIDNRPTKLNQFSRLYFLQDFNDINSAVDIIHIGSTLQYIEGWQELLQSLVDKFRPKYFVFSDLLAGDVPTFVSHQIFYEKRIPHMFLNLSDFCDFMTKKFNMNLLFKTKFIRLILNQEEIFPNFALPEKYQIDRSCNLVFAHT